MIMSRTCVDPHHCITCSDEGIAMRVLSVNPEWGSALCTAVEQTNGAEEAEQQEVLIGLVNDVTPGDVILVHAGAALVRLGVHNPTSENAGGDAS